jgi:hypothetical protein
MTRLHYYLHISYYFCFYIIIISKNYPIYWKSDISNLGKQNAAGAEQGREMQMLRGCENAQDDSLFREDQLQRETRDHL